MSIAEFSATIKSAAYKTWLSSLETNLVTQSIKDIRKREQTSAKTDFLVTSSNLKEMFESLSGTKIDSHDIDVMMAQLSGKLGTRSYNAVTGNTIKVNGKTAVLFENIGFDTISEVMKRVLDTPEIDGNLHDLSLKAQDEAKAQLKARGKYTKEEFRKADNIKITIGDFFDKGHVVSLATNLGKNFANEIRKTEALSNNVKDHLLEVLEQYVDKLQKDDLATANLPNAVTQEVYAKYIKSSDKYLVEFQSKKTNQLAGTASLPIVLELREMFSTAENAATIEMAKASAIGGPLIRTKGSPSYIDLIAKDLANQIIGKPKEKKIYTIAATKVLSNTIKIVKPKRNTAEIAAAKNLIKKLKYPKVPPNTSLVNISIEGSVVNLQALIQARLALQIKSNMGTGSATRVLNYRSGRLAESAQIERLSTSREGTISVFYNYMKNPYATFSEGGRQQTPTSRDPKTLISKSIREIGATLTSSRMRAVLV